MSDQGSTVEQSKNEHFRYVILVRHGASEGITSKYGYKQPSLRGLSRASVKDAKSGEQEVIEVADRLSQVIEEGVEDGKWLIRIGAEILSSTHTVATETADIFAHFINQAAIPDQIRVQVTQQPLLDPEKAQTHSDKPVEPVDAIGCIESDLKAFVEKGSNAIVVVGHQPMLGWIANTLTGKPVAIPRSGAACLRCDTTKGKGYKLLWVIEPSRPETMNLLREKIKSKTELAKVFGSFIIGVMVFLAGVAFDTGKLTPLTGWQKIVLCGAAVCFALSGGLYFATIYAYDRLMMPSRFWGEKRGERPDWLVRRPPSSDTVVVQQNMVRIWNRLFVPASFFGFAGSLLVVSVVLSRIVAPDSLLILGITIVVSGCVMVAIYRWYAVFRPVLGTED